MMDEDTENVINLIFPNGVPAHLQDSPEFLSYLTKLGSFRVEQLVKEPERLAEEKASVLEQTQELAFSNYKTFIQTAECSRAIFQQFKDTEGRLDSLLTRLPQLAQQCQDFSRASASIESQRRLCSLTLSRSTQLLELLEIPQLMSMCVSGGHYEEALQLAAYVRRLERRHANIPAIESIVRDTQAAWQSMLLQLLAQLRSDLPLPKCLLVVGLLRRMEVFSEAELRLKFLQARDAWLRALLEGVPKGSEHLARTVELSRQHLFAIATQYRAAFSDDPTRATSNEGAIFHGWLTERVTQFIITLEQDLSQLGESEPLDSILSQCMYFGLSLARVGADFRGLISPVFIKAIRRNLEYMIRKAGKDFENQMEKFCFDKIQSSSSNSTPNTSSPLQPPVSLLQFPPLALYCNALLSSLNTLRLCAPLALAETVTTQLQTSLTLAAKIILSRYRQEQQAFTSAEKQGLQRLCACFADDLVSHLQKCLQALYPLTTLATHLGMSPQDIQKQSIGVIDKTQVIESIFHLLPVQLEPINLLPPSIEKDEEFEQNGPKGDTMEFNFKADLENSTPEDDNKSEELITSEVEPTSKQVTELDINPTAPATSNLESQFEELNLSMSQSNETEDT